MTLSQLRYELLDLVRSLKAKLNDCMPSALLNFQVVINHDLTTDFGSLDKVPGEILQDHS